MTDQALRAIPPRADMYWVQVRAFATVVGSNGCTGVLDFYIDACYEHDIHWRTGHTLHGEPISTRQANMRFRLVIQNRSPFGVLSPMSWWRWLAVSVVGVIKNGR